MGGVVEVTDVDGPHGDTDDGDHFRQLVAELVQFLLQRGLLSLSLTHLSTDLTCGWRVGSEIMVYRFRCVRVLC